jgi:hypothetical protein
MASCNSSRNTPDVPNISPHSVDTFYSDLVTAPALSHDDRTCMFGPWCSIEVRLSLNTPSEPPQKAHFSLARHPCPLP